jgi:DNA ligase-associated metallophosphoesterase
MQPLKFGDEIFFARADRTLWHEASRTLFLSDCHLGKGAHFRQSGIPIPDGGETEDLDRLVNAITETDAHAVWVLGDLFHQPQSITSQQMDRWASAFAPIKAELNVILGNHDRRAEHFATSLGYSIQPEPTDWNGIELAHHPDESNQLRIAGHIHPQVEFKTNADRIVCPCFAVQDDRLLLLPAFTAFSGGPRFQPKQAACYAIVGDDVLPPMN